MSKSNKMPALTAEKPKHAPRPWNVVDLTADVENGQLRIDSDGGCIADCGRGRFVDDESRANAARIVACVNACEGIEDPAELRAQRDELLKLVKRVPYQLSSANAYTPEQRKEIFAEIDALVARCGAEGRKS